MRLQKKLIIGVFAVLVFFTAQNAKADPLVITFNNDVGACIKFDGLGHFTFQDSALGWDFKIGTQSTNFGDQSAGASLVGLYGNISGTFNIGTPTTIAGGQKASVTTTDGLFSIYDGKGGYFTAALNWLDIRQIGTGDTLNIASGISLSDFKYSGPDPANLNANLLQLRDGPGGVLTLSFTLPPPVGSDTLTSLSTSGIQKTAGYAGSVSVPEPSVLLLLGSGLIGLALFGRFRVTGK